ncbi:hypothetical protein F5148DRAFT_1332188 [Russula earlei]|uniref:Uncharacterized protein n=1 Tax=Russula earlei TaxID=71964 RepID=A0ACC0UHZ7_9AGAM|nr:hypothetical protein F5148DRAFT_1332188 [Russula earlei]
MASAFSSHSPSPIPAVAVVFDSSITLASEWHHVLHVYLPQLLHRLAGGTSSPHQLRLGIVTYGPPDCDGSPLFINRFFASGVPDELKEDPTRLAIGRTVTGGSLGMAALEGYAAAIEMFDNLKSGVNQKPLRPLTLNESRDKPKEEFSCYLWHFAAGQPDDAKHPYWNSSPALDNLTWTTVPAELKKRDINCSMLLVRPSPKFSELFSTMRDYYHGFLPALITPFYYRALRRHLNPEPQVPPTIPAKRPAETPAEQRSPGPKIVRPPSQTASPALAAAKRPIPQSSPLVPPAPAPAPPSSAFASPAPQASPPKPPSREPPESGVIDLTQPTPELAPASVQNRPLPSKPNPPQQAPSLPNLTRPPQPTQPPTQSPSLTTSQPQVQPPMQPQPQPPSQPPSLPLNLGQMANADVADLQAKLKQVEIRIIGMRNRQMEAAQAGRTEEAKQYDMTLAQQMAVYKKGLEFVMKVMQTKRFLASGQAQGSSQPHDSAPNSNTKPLPTPAVSATPQSTPSTSSQSAPQVATQWKPGIPMTPNTTYSSPMNGSNPAATEIPPQVGLGSVSVPDAHALSAAPQHGHSHSNSIGQQPPQITPAVAAAQMKKLAEQRGLAQNNQGLAVGGNSAGTNATAGPSTGGSFGDHQWSGTLMWQGTDTTRNEKKEVRAQVTATTSKGNPLTSTWPKGLSLAPAGPTVSMDEFQEWIRKTNPAIMQIHPAPGTDEHHYGQLVKLLRDKSYYAVAGWEIQGMNRPTMNILIAPFAQGLLGAVFPTTGMPPLPTSRLPQLDPAIRQVIFDKLPPNYRSLPEPQLSKTIMQIFVRQQHHFQAMQGMNIPMPNTGAIPQQQPQSQPQPQPQHRQPQHQQQQQQIAGSSPNNVGVNIPNTGSIFGKMGLKQGELNPFVPGSQANAIASGLLVQPTSLQHLQQHQQAHAQQQQQQQHQVQQNQQRTFLEVHRALNGGLGAGVGNSLGGALMNTGSANAGFGLSGALGPLSIGSIGPAGITGASNGLEMGGFRNGGNGMNGPASSLGLALNPPVSGASFGGLSTAGTGLDGRGESAVVGAATGPGGLAGVVGMGGMPPGSAGGVTLDMYQSFLHRRGEGGPGPGQ